MKTNVIVLHQYGAPSHYIGLEKYLKERYNSKPIYREFDLHKQLYRLLRSPSAAGFKKFFSNMWYLLSLTLGIKRGAKIVLGIAPFDYKMNFLIPILYMNELYWHTSWPSWADSRKYPYPKSTKKVPFSWRLFFGRLKMGFFVTEKGKISFIQNYNYSFKKVTVWHAVNSSNFNLKLSERNTSSDKKVLRLCFVGRIEKHKGIELIFETIKKLEKLNVKFSFDFIGDGVLAEEVKKFCSTRAYCIHHGKLPRSMVFKLLSEYDVILQPSIKHEGWEEAFGLAIVEAMLHNVVPICTNHTGPDTLLGNELKNNLITEDEFVNSALEILKHYYLNVGKLESDKLVARKKGEYYLDKNISPKWRGICEPQK